MLDMKILINAARATAQEMFEAGSEPRSEFYIHIDGGVVPIDCSGEKLKVPREAVRALVKKIVHGLRCSGKLQAVVLLGNAWIRVFDHGDKEGLLKASKEGISKLEDKKECLFVVGWDSEGNKSGGLWDIGRNEDGSFSGLTYIGEEQAINGECWLDSAFVTAEDVLKS